MSRTFWPCLVLPLLLLSPVVHADDRVDFNRDIRPLLSDRCFACHGPDDNTREADLRLDRADGVVESSSAVVIAGKPEDSVLFDRIMSADADEVMPPPTSNKSLSEADKELLRRWIEQGANWENHWAYVKPTRKTPPEFDDIEFANPIDAFIRQRLLDKHLSASPQADRVTLIRRLYFDLIGLPPTSEQVAAFLNDESPEAYAKVVDELLQSRHFGERLAIYWLDVVRYADSNGYHSDEPRQIAPYRSYVIEAFNTNMPYDQFIIEQLAGDLLPEPTVRQQIASGFNMLLQTTSEGGAQAKEYIAKYAADRVRNTSQIFLGSTMGCAECHNHKFDPFTQKDFYSFAAFFADIQQPAVGNPATFPVMMPEDRQRVAEFDSQAAEIQKQLDTPTADLAAAQVRWEAEVQSTASQTPRLGAWHKIGPFTAGSFDEAHAKAFVDPSAVQLEQPIGEQKWQPADYADGKVHALKLGANAAFYLHRTVQVEAATKLALSLGSDDSVTVWINGEVAHDNKVGRGVAADQDKVEVALPAGTSELLIKICNGQGAAGFYFNAGGSNLPANVLAILETQAQERTAAQASELAAYYRSIAPALQPSRDQLARVAAEKKQFLDSRPRTMMTMTGAPRDVRLLNRGDWLDDSGAIMEPAIPEFLGNLEVASPRGNRLDLARWIANSENPLTARTLVNRLWKLYFGRGLATPLDDLGRQGSLPTHPELLDWLAIELMESDWDVKHMIRLMVMSETYRQSSNVTDDLKREDPYNELYARQARFRLDAEIVRDNALAVSGLLVKEVGGRSVYPYQPAGYWSHMNFPARSWPTDQGDSLYRRGVYTWWQRMFLHPAMVAFDAPSREECTVERPRSNIPQQALVLLNDPAFVEAARVFAERAMRSGGDDLQQRIKWAWTEVLSRDPEPRELDILLRIYETHLAEYQSDAAAARALLDVGSRPVSEDLDVAELAAWTSVARVLLNLHETITRP